MFRGSGIEKRLKTTALEQYSDNYCTAHIKVSSITVPTTGSRPSTNLSAFSFYCADY